MKKLTVKKTSLASKLFLAIAIVTCSAAITSCDDLENEFCPKDKKKRKEHRDTIIVKDTFNSGGDEIRDSFYTP